MFATPTPKIATKTLARKAKLIKASQDKYFFMTCFRILLSTNDLPVYEGLIEKASVQNQRNLHFSKGSRDVDGVEAGTRIHKNSGPERKALNTPLTTGTSKLLQNISHFLL